MDILENSTTLNTHADRLGVMRKTRKGMELEHDNQISAHESEHDNQMQSFESDFDSRLAGMAFTRVGTFAAGYTLTDARQVLVYETDGHEYGWTGAFPKVVTPASTPAGTGGIGAGAWVDRTDVSLRAEITASVTEALRRSYADAGFTLVGGSFESGGTLNNTNDVLLHKASGIAYSWGWTLPKVVIDGSTPATSGGVGAGAWVDRTQESLREYIISLINASELEEGVLNSQSAGIQTLLDSGRIHTNSDFEGHSHLPVKLNGGSYRVDDVLHLRRGSIIGTGQGSTTLYALHCEDEFCISASHDEAYQGMGPEIRNLSIFGHPNKGVVFETAGSILSSVTVSNCGNGIRYNGSGDGLAKFATLWRVSPAPQAAGQIGLSQFFLQEPLAKTENRV
jgi:hypothetical protein